MSPATITPSPSSIPNPHHYEKIVGLTETWLRRSLLFVSHDCRLGSTNFSLALKNLRLLSPTILWPGRMRAIIYWNSFSTSVLYTI